MFSPSLLIRVFSNPERRDSRMRIVVNVDATISSNAIGDGEPERTLSEKACHSAAWPFSCRNQERNFLFFPSRTNSRQRKSSSTATQPEPKTSILSFENVRSPLQA